MQEVKTTSNQSIQDESSNFQKILYKDERGITCVGYMPKHMRLIANASVLDQKSKGFGDTPVKSKITFKKILKMLKN